MNNAPCYQCKLRQPGCHGKCRAYYFYRQLQEQLETNEESSDVREEKE